MTYYFSKKVSGTFEQVLEKVVEKLKKEGFGIITEIDVKDTFKKKLDIDFRRYHILGACNPSFAYRALEVEDKIGTMLPCNVIVQELPTREIEVAAIAPLESMKAVDNPSLKEIAAEIQSRLKMVIESL